MAVALVTAGYVQGYLPFVSNLFERTNCESFHHFRSHFSGDIIVVTGSLTGHAGEFDWSRYYDLDSYCIWSANTQPVNGVQLEQPVKYRNYDEAWGLWVPGASYNQRLKARDYCAAQDGEPYDILSSKSNQDSWYCSKLVWASYYYTSAGIDLDGDGGAWVKPEDLIIDTDTAMFEYSP